MSIDYWFFQIAVYNQLLNRSKLKEDLYMFCLLIDYDSLFAKRCMVMHELTFCSQYLLFKSLAHAQSKPAASLTVDNSNWLAKLAINDN